LNQLPIVFDCSACGNVSPNEPLEDCISQFQPECTLSNAVCGLAQFAKSVTIVDQITNQMKQRSIGEPFLKSHKGLFNSKPLVFGSNFNRIEPVIVEMESRKLIADIRNRGDLLEKELNSTSRGCGSFGKEVPHLIRLKLLLDCVPFLAIFS
jgi:hypothetical protein